TLMDSKRKILETYRVALGFDPKDHKQQEGDGRTPEGKYKISWKNAGSRFYKSLKISYPNAQDRRHAKALGVSPGGDVFIHGLGKEFSFLGVTHRLRDWTLGCVAVTNGEIDEIWKRVDQGTPIEILP
ncbi:MAG: L,D-transpeptidase family protein, partial [bacterium]|nr:L,D-transpeptidase family protein [bacterium]